MYAQDLLAYILLRFGCGANSPLAELGRMGVFDEWVRI